ncbi:hypothetical protein Cgig2_018966 [Carnegiea gigantea]|uniref:Uncharacterized protein n=1 Tax=Carnegiea gigantea TaxID=171969 RepID=A0A9Q1K2B2_9CARY|nr:hypothetical protein Cgig2_018966 [Carnegiea gigantea]
MNYGKSDLRVKAEEKGLFSIASQDLKVTVIITTSMSSKSPHSVTTVKFVHISDGFKEKEKTDDANTGREGLKVSISKSLMALIDHCKQNKENLNPTAQIVVCNSFMPWVLDVIKKSGVEGGPFFTQSCVINSIHYHAYKGTLKTRVSGSLVSLPDITGLLSVDDLPSFVSSPGTHPDIWINSQLLKRCIACSLILSTSRKSRYQKKRFLVFVRPRREKTDDVNTRRELMKALISKSLIELIDRYKKSKAKKWLQGGPFFTHSCVVNTIYFHAHKAAFKTPYTNMKVGLDQFSNFEEADYLFINTVDKLEIRVSSEMYPETEICIPWLKARENGSIACISMGVVYISMGSLASLRQE